MRNFSELTERDLLALALFSEEDGRATVLAGVAAVIEWSIIAWVEWKHMGTPRLSAAAKVMLGSAPVLATGILIGSA